MNIEKINQELNVFFVKYGGIVKLLLYFVIFIWLSALIFYFIDVHITFKEIAENPIQYCTNKIIPAIG
jgi:archaellum biogenesis protein FlaJ (TadC family)